MEAPATILAPEGAVPLGEHAWRRAGEEVRLTVTALATEAEVEEYTEQQRADLEAAATAACNAAREHLADAAGVAIEGMPQAEYNAVYLPAGEHKSWSRFESADGKHLYRQIERQFWEIRDTFEPDPRGPPKAFAEAAGGVCLLGSSSGSAVATV